MLLQLSIFSIELLFIFTYILTIKLLFFCTNKACKLWKKKKIHKKKYFSIKKNIFCEYFLLSNEIQMLFSFLEFCIFIYLFIIIV